MNEIGLTTRGVLCLSFKIYFFFLVVALCVEAAGNCHYVFDLQRNACFTSTSSHIDRLVLASHDESVEPGGFFYMHWVIYLKAQCYLDNILTFLLIINFRGWSKEFLV